jgi:hemerythrin-like domain-containing protein
MTTKTIEKLPTQILEEEHDVILKMLKIIRSVSNKIDGVDTSILQSIIDFIRNFADHCHHAKEEKVLFVEGEKAGIPKEGGPIGMMLTEHDQGRNYVKGADAALQEAKRGDKKSLETYKDNLLQFADLLEQHIMKENQILYPMINMHLVDELQKEILDRFEKVEKEDVGEGVHHKYHHLVEELEKKFLK